MPQPYSRDPEVDRSLRYSVRDGVAWSLMFGAGESYLQAFAVFLKASTAQIMLFDALPSILGSAAQLASAWAAGYAVRRKSLIFAGVLLQSVAWLPIIALAFIPVETSVALLIVAVVLYYVGGQFAAPPWSSLIGARMGSDPGSDPLKRAPPEVRIAGSRPSDCTEADREGGRVTASSGW